MPHPPAYDAYEIQSRPTIHWETPQGSWVGIWGYDWPDQLGAQILKIEPKLEYEVWQPDLRADKIYAHRLEGGVVHKLFPARSHGISGPLTSTAIVDELAVLSLKGEVILHLNYLRDALSNEILDRSFGLPTVLEFHGTISLPSNEFWKVAKNPMRTVRLLGESSRLKSRFSNVRMIVHKNHDNLETLRRVYSGPFSQITMGVDFDFWKRRNKHEARKALGIAGDAFVFLLVSRLVDLKQVDKFIEALIGVQTTRSVQCIVVGNGDSHYIDSLRRIVARAPKEISFEFPGYIRGDKLIDYYSAADVFVAVSLSEGASVASMEAMACEVPSFSTDAGATAELLVTEGKGAVVGKRDYREWKIVLEKILASKQTVDILPRRIAGEHYHWPNVATRFLSMYKQVLRLSNG